MPRVVTFGEIMGRIEPYRLERFRQALPGSIHMSFAGAEANVAASIAILGGTSRFVSALPRHTVADAALDSLRGLGVDTGSVLRRDEGRMGLFFVEGGANQRPSEVTYDRDDSTISRTPGSEYDWDPVFEDADWFHITGITPGLSKTAADATIHSARLAKAANLRVSVDLNFRNKLWRWDPDLTPRSLAGLTMREVLPHVDVVICNEEDAGDVLGIHASETDVQAGELAVDQYRTVATRIVAEFPNLSIIGITLRQSISASWNNWGAMLYDVKTERAHFAPEQDGKYAPYEIRNIVDRVGGGDSFAAGLIFALLTPGLNETETAVRFATAASCLAHSIPGDFNLNDRLAVERLMEGSSSGRVIR